MAQWGGSLYLSSQHIASRCPGHIRPLPQPQDQYHERPAGGLLAGLQDAWPQPRMGTRPPEAKQSVSPLPSPRSSPPAGGLTLHKAFPAGPPCAPCSRAHDGTSDEQSEAGLCPISHALCARGCPAGARSRARLTISQLLHVVVKHGLLQGGLVIGADGVRVGVGAVVPRPRPREGARGLRVEEGGLVVQSRPASFHHLAAAPALGRRGGDATITGHLGQSTLSVPPSLNLHEY